MKPAAFIYHAPKSLDEAIATLAEVAPKDGRIIAGGQVWCRPWLSASRGRNILSTSTPSRS